MALGIGTLLAAMNVAYRDFKAMIPFLTQLWMFATPTIYTGTVKHLAVGALAEPDGRPDRLVPGLDPRPANPLGAPGTRRRVRHCSLA